jgi:glucan-binding YG repeat protein
MVLGLIAVVYFFMINVSAHAETIETTEVSETTEEIGTTEASETTEVSGTTETTEQITGKDEQQTQIVTVEAGWYKINGKYYYLKSSGVRVEKKAGWYKINGKYYYLKSSGVRVEKKAGWYKINGRYYYLKSSGVRVEKKADWYEINGRYYYLKSSGVRVEKKTGWYKINGKYYYLKSSGVRVEKKTGWYKINEKYYYLKTSGACYNGWQYINSKKYYFDSKGRLAEGLFKVNGTKYYQTKEQGLHTSMVVMVSETGKYYYVNETGKVVDDKLTKELLKVYKACVKPGMSKEQQLKACYMYFATYKTSNKHFVYDRRYDDYLYVGKSGWINDYAYQILSTGKGNCYRFACAFGCMAKLLGYDVNILTGQTRATRGGYTPHCITQVKLDDGKYYYFDSEIEFANNTNMYKMERYKGTFIDAKSYKLKL